jgi:hypothetical protein
MDNNDHNKWTIVRIINNSNQVSIPRLLALGG